MTEFDVAIIGAGPGGMSAAIEARAAGLSVAVLDEQPAPGGQIWRGVETASPELCKIMGPDYARGAEVVRAFRAASASYFPGASVWDITPERSLRFTRPEGPGSLSAKALILATGALERAMPLPGWTLPGVTTAGALQILLKTSSLGARDAVLAGNGPLIWLIAAQMIAAGVPPAAIVEVATPGARAAALRHLRGALGHPGMVFKGLGLIRRVKAAGVPIYRAAEALEVEGAHRVEALSFLSRGKRVRLETECIALHNGILPNQQATRLLRCAHVWDEGQAAFRPGTDPWGETDRADIFIVGDGAGIAGARAAELSGRLAARRIAERLGKRPAGAADSVEADLARERAFRPFIDSLYPPAPQCAEPADDTIVCRCEEIRAGAIRSAVAQGAPGPNQAKAFLRCGMGPCQGRVCGTQVARMMASGRGKSEEETGYYSIRPPLKPLLLGDLAAVTKDAAE